MYGYVDRNERKAQNRQFQEASSYRKACGDTQYFWDMVNRNRGPYGAAPVRKPINLAQEEKTLFSKSVETAEHGFIDDNIPVERSGPRADEIPVLSSFAELEGQVPPFISHAIQLMGYVTPTPIQKHAVPLGLAGVDLMCCAQTGSGKTFSFMLPVVASMDRLSVSKVPVGMPPKDQLPSTEALTDTTDTPDEQKSISETPTATNFQFIERVSIDQRGALPLAVVLAPTRELASQIHLDARRLMFGSTLKSVCVYGGNDLRLQLQELSSGCDLIVATPGRLNDLVERGCVSLSQVSLLVLDEADRMLDMGFEPQIRRIVSESDMPPTGERQTFLFSATFPDEIQTLAREFLHNYVWIGVGRVGSTVENIKQQVLCSTSDPNYKIKLLLGAIEQTDGRTLVFVQKRRTASWLCDCLRNQCGIRAEEIHGDRTQAQREHALKQFRDGQIRILVATDVAARGLDVPAVTHVIQFDLPLSSEDFDVYVHRIGRTGRAGMDGLATALFVPGREPGEGNGKIAPQILRLLQENNQEIPDWFASLDDHNPAYNNRGGGNYRQRPYGGAGGYGQGGGYGQQQQRFGGRDVRGDFQTHTYTESYGQGGGYQAHQGYGHHGQQGFQQRAPYGGGGGRGRGGGAGYSAGGSYGQQQGYQQRNAYGQDGYGRRPPQQQQYGAQAYGAAYGGAAQYGAAPAAHAGYGAPATAPAASTYYDPYGGGAYPAATPAAAASTPGAADPSYSAVDAMVGQFAGMAMQGHAAAAVPPAYAAAGAQAGMYGQRAPVAGAQHGAQSAPAPHHGQQRPQASYSRPMDPAAGYMPAAPSTLDPYSSGFPPQAPAAQYPAYQTKPTNTYAQAPGGYGQQQQAPQDYGHQQRGAQGGYPQHQQYAQQQHGYGAQQAARYAPQHAYGAPQHYQIQAPQGGHYDPVYAGGAGSMGHGQVGGEAADGAPESSAPGASST